jgi:chaperonin GroES
MALQPLHDRVLVRPAAPEETTAGGIIIPDTAKEKPQEGEIIAVGTGRTTEDGKLIPMNVSTGDKVIYGKYGGTEITVNNEDLLIMKESDIYAIVK